MAKRLFKQRQAFRDWLQRHHDKESELWLEFYKKGSGKTSIRNQEAVEEALCFGWINGKVIRIDDERYMQRFSPRQDKSIWSEANKRRVEDLIESGRMTEAGLKKVEAAKQNGSWDQLAGIDPEAGLPQDLERALRQNPRANQNFHNFTALQRRDYLWWLDSAKRPETRRRRIEAIVERSAHKIKPGADWP